MNNVANTTVESLIQKFAELKGTGKERPGKRFKIIEINKLYINLLICCFVYILTLIFTD